ncbi:hypothetical protein DVH24_039598 [Malus domestica]|uniref:Uncharacterized protein n=1 Tax=Malus domestica TaxID=3750 RepID=A0A498I6Q7_MALDO|nr:hypothetical protein DVH24_039598 [Malus domestica]
MLSTRQHFMVPVTTVLAQRLTDSQITEGRVVGKMRICRKWIGAGPGAADASNEDSTDDLSNVTWFVMLALKAGGARVSLCSEDAALLVAKEDIADDGWHSKPKGSGRLLSAYSFCASSSPFQTTMRDLGLPIYYKAIYIWAYL